VFSSLDETGASLPIWIISYIYTIQILKEKIIIIIIIIIRVVAFNLCVNSTLGRDLDVIEPRFLADPKSG